MKSRLGEIFTLEVPIYPKLVRAFFENLRIGTNSIKSRVKDTLIVMMKGD